jgi:hypothetical protein
MMAVGDKEHGLDGVDRRGLPCLPTVTTEPLATPQYLSAVCT